jgi:YHS domain-containing protein
VIRLFLGLIAILVAFALIRSLLEPVVKALVALLTPASAAHTSAGVRPESQHPSNELKRDPVCGTFVAAELAVTQQSGGQLIHFCSAKCRDEYARRQTQKT